MHAAQSFVWNAVATARVSNPSQGYALLRPAELCSVVLNLDIQCEHSFDQFWMPEMLLRSDTFLSGAMQSFYCLSKTFR